MKNWRRWRQTLGSWGIFLLLMGKLLCSSLVAFVAIRLAESGQYESMHYICRYIVHVIDTDPMSLASQGWLEDTSKVEKYVMSDADYDARENTYRKFKQEKLKEDPTWTLEKEIAKRRGVPYTAEDSAATVEDDEHQAEEASHLRQEERCEVVTQEGCKRGRIKYIGKCEGLPKGYWVGVEYDEPVGKNDGSAKGHRYFECEPKYGGFVRPGAVSMGDYPPFDDELDFDEDDEL